MEQASSNGHFDIARMLLLSGVSLSSQQPLPPDIVKFYEYIILHNTKRPKIVYSLRDQGVYLFMREGGETGIMVIDLLTNLENM